MNGVPPEELVELRSHDLPPGCDYLWDWFIRLRDTRPQGFGDGAITETELRCFFLNRSIKPTPWELDLLVRMDAEARDAIADKTAPATESEPQEE